MPSAISAKRFFDGLALFDVVQKFVKRGGICADQPLDQCPALRVEGALRIRLVVEIRFGRYREEFLQRDAMMKLQRLNMGRNRTSGANRSAA